VKRVYLEAELVADKILTEALGFTKVNVVVEGRPIPVDESKLEQSGQGGTETVEAVKTPKGQRGARQASKMKDVETEMQSGEKPGRKKAACNVLSDEMQTPKGKKGKAQASKTDEDEEHGTPAVPNKTSKASKGKGQAGKTEDNDNDRPSVEQISPKGRKAKDQASNTKAKDNDKPPAEKARRGRKEKAEAGTTEGKERDEQTPKHGNEEQTAADCPVTPVARRGRTRLSICSADGGSKTSLLPSHSCDSLLQGMSKVMEKADLSQVAEPDADVEKLTVEDEDGDGFLSRELTKVVLESARNRWNKGTKADANEAATAKADAKAEAEQHPRKKPKKNGSTDKIMEDEPDKETRNTKEDVDDHPAARQKPQRKRKSEKHEAEEVGVTIGGGKKTKTLEKNGQAEGERVKVPSATGSKSMQKRRESKPVEVQEVAASAKAGKSTKKSKGKKWRRAQAKQAKGPNANEGASDKKDEVGEAKNGGEITQKEETETKQAIAESLALKKKAEEQDEREKQDLDCGIRDSLAHDQGLGQNSSSSGCKAPEKTQSTTPMSMAQVVAYLKESPLAEAAAAAAALAVLVKVDGKDKPAQKTSEDKPAQQSAAMPEVTETPKLPVASTTESAPPAQSAPAAQAAPAQVALQVGTKPNTSSHASEFANFKRRVSSGNFPGLQDPAT
jgi:hypothetical protein